MRKLSLYFILAVLALLTMSRLALVVWLWPRVVEADGLWPLLIGGLRTDVSMTAAIMLIPLALSPWLGHREYPTRITALWYRFWWLVLLLMELATPQFILEYDTRPNRLFFEYLGHPGEIFAMLWQGYMPALAAIVAVMLVGAWLSVRIMPVRPDVRFATWPRRAMLSAGLMLLCIVASRGTLMHRPINPAMVAFTNDRMVNTLALNSLYNTAYAVYQMKNERSAASIYGDMDKQQMHKLVHQAAGLHEAMPDSALPSLHYQQATKRRGKPLNLVIIVEESLGAQYVGSLGGKDLTPELDKLAEKGWWFKSLYATGTRLARGLEAIVTGFPPTPARSVLKLPRAQNGFFTLASLLGGFGYESRFIYGGESHFDNMKGFFLNNGFDQVIDRSSFTDPLFVGSWGASDEDSFNKLHDVLLADGDKATFTLLFSVSNHSPWEYPSSSIKPVGNPSTPDNTVRYADWALGDFFRKAEKAPYWDNTIFLVVADHDSKVRGNSLVPVNHFHIPAVILGADTSPYQDDRVVSQIDLAPTLLSLMGIDSSHPMLGHDLTWQSPNRAIMQYGNNYGYLHGNQLLVLSPEQEPLQYQYQEGTLTPVDTSDHLANMALAHVLWPSWAYREQRYIFANHNSALLANDVVNKPPGEYDLVAIGQDN